MTTWAEARRTRALVKQEAAARARLRRATAKLDVLKAAQYIWSEFKRGEAALDPTRAALFAEDAAFTSVKMQGGEEVGRDQMSAEHMLTSMRSGSEDVSREFLATYKPTYVDVTVSAEGEQATISYLFQNGPGPPGANKLSVGRRGTDWVIIAHEWCVPKPVLDPPW